MEYAGFSISKSSTALPHKALHVISRDDLNYTQRNMLCKGFQYLWILVPMAEGRTMGIEGCQDI